MSARSDFINGHLMGKPYRLGRSGPDEFDCYGLARTVEREIFGRDMPVFSAPEGLGRHGLAALIQAHPERRRWVERDGPEDGALVSMARHEEGYHLGVFLSDDGGIVLHAMEGMGVVADTLLSLEAAGWRRFRFHVPA